LTKFLVVKLAGVYKALEATEGSETSVGEANDVLDFVLVMLGELFAVVWGLCAEEVFLDTEGSLIWSDEDNDEDWVRFPVTVRLCEMIGVSKLTAMIWN